MINTSPNNQMCELYTLKELAEKYNTTGDVVEFGTFTGRSTLQLSHLFPDKTVFTIDHFKGLEKTNKNIPSDSDWVEHTFAIGNPLYDDNENVPKSVEELKGRFYGRTNIKMIIQDVHKLELPTYYNIGEVGACNIDVDIYEPTVSALEFLTKCKWNEVVIRFDDWHGGEEEYDQHERLAFVEWIEKYGYEYEVIHGGYCGGVYVKR